MQYPLAWIAVGAVAAYALAFFTASKVADRGFPLPAQDKRIGCVDGLRGWLALSVMIHHAVMWTQMTRLGGAWSVPTVHILNQLGVGSVALFFMVTGLVFYPRVKAGFASTSWLHVYVGRFARILPLLMSSVALFCVVIAIRTGHLPDRNFPSAIPSWVTGRDEPALLGYADSWKLNAFVLWSIWFEWLFYFLVLPVCALSVDLLRGRMPPVTVPVVMLILGLVSWRLGNPIELFKYVPLFAAGMIAFECKDNLAVRHFLQSRVVGLAASAALLTAILMHSTPYHLTALIPFGLFFVCVAAGNDLGGVFKARASLVLGEISFGTYLLHGFILWVFFLLGGDLLALMSPGAAFAIAVGIGAVAIVIFATGAHLLIEKPGMAAGKRLIKSARTAPIAGGSVPSAI